jgi:hypothetical protein
VARFAGIVISIFIASFCTVSTTFPLFWTLFGFFELIDLAAWGMHRSTNAIVTASMYSVAALGVVTLCALIIEYTFGIRNPAKALEGETVKRLSDLASFFHVLSKGNLSIGNEEFRSLHNQLIHQAHARDFYLLNAISWTTCNEVIRFIKGSEFQSTPRGRYR